MQEQDLWVSVDGAKTKSGVAFWSGTEFCRTELIKGVSWSAWKTAVSGIRCIVLEDGFIGKGKSKSTALKLANARGRIAMAADVAGASELHHYQSATWRSKVGIPTNAPRSTQKQAAQRMCAWLATSPATRPPPRRPDSAWKALYYPGLIDVTVDEAEAVLLGLAHLVIAGRI